MKREEIKALLGDGNISDKLDSIIDSIMKANGDDINKQKKEAEKANEKIKNLESELKTSKDTLAEANVQIQKFKEMDVEGIKASADEWKSKYETSLEDAKTREKDFNKQMKQKDYEFAVKEYVNGLEFTSDFAKNAFTDTFLKQEFKLNEGKLLGADDYIKQFKESNQGVFKEETQETTDPKENQNTYTYKPKGGESTPDIAAQIEAAINGTM